MRARSSVIVGTILVLAAISAPAMAAESEIGMVDPAQGMWHLRGSDGRVASFFYGNPGDYPILGDWDCNGTTTPGMYRQSDGYVYLRNSNTQGVGDIRFFFGDPGDIPIVGDFNGDGCDTVSIYRPTEGRAFIINQLGQNEGGLGAAEFDYYFGNPGDKPFVGDFDGDGVATVGLHRESTGFVYFRNSHTQGVADNEFFFGDPGDRFVAGDWTGDGTDTPGLFRPDINTWYFRYTNTQGNADASTIWGANAWIPIAGVFGSLTLTPAPGDFAPFTISGTGDDVVSLSLPGEEPAVLRFDYSGPSNFIAWSLDGAFDTIDLLVNEIGNYSGARPVNTKAFGDSPIRYLDITASAAWTVEVEPISLALTLAGSVSGIGDDVVQLANTGRAQFTYTGSSNFIVWALRRSGEAELLVNEIGNYGGVQVLPSWAEYLDIVGIGDWSVTLVP